MSSSKGVPEAPAGLQEPHGQHDDRIAHLWTRLNTGNAATLDLKGLQRGFRKIDHPMKNADNMLKKIMKEVDANGDGRIQYEEFRTFVQKAERQLETLFRAIDKDGNGKLDKGELQAAFKSAGLSVSNKRLASFFNDMDINDDGYITFEEWRDFLLFMPAREYDSKLHAVLSFYDSVVSVTPEGDSIVSDETLEGLGTESSSSSLLESLFGSLLRVATPMPPPMPPPTSYRAQELEEEASPGMNIDADAEPATNVAAMTRQQQAPASVSRKPAGSGTQGSPTTTRGTRTKSTQIQDTEDSSADGADEKKTKKKKYILTDFAPHPGYFLAGAIAGGVSRTATAPLDRLKVYLLVNTNSGTETALGALKKGKPIAALKNGTQPFRDAVRDLFRSGGLRGFFAGNGLNVLKIMPETAIKFGSYEAAKRAFANMEGHGDPKLINSYSKFTAGGVAGMIAQFFVYPLDTLKFRLQCETVEGGLTGAALVRQTAVKMYADGGLRACYRGVTMGLVGMFPYSAIDMGMFELLKKSYKSYMAKKMSCHEDDVQPGNIATGIIGASSGAFGASVVYPLNVVRTRLQTQGTSMHRATYTGIWDVTTKTIQREGYRGLYKGLTPNLLKVAPALSITWVVYENSKRVLGLH